MSDLRFLIRSVIVSVAAMVVLTAMGAIWSEDTGDAAEHYCFYKDDYFSRGAIVDMEGSIRRCGASPDDDERLE